MSTSRSLFLLCCTLSLIACGGGTPPGSVVRARALYEKGEVARAETLARELMKEPLSPGVRAELAELLIDLQLAEEAVRAVREGKEVSTAGHYALARAWIRLSNASQAEIELDSLPDKTTGRALCLHGQLALARGRPGEASRRLAAAVQADPEDLRSWLWVGLGLLEEGKISAARESLSRARARFPDSPELRAAFAAALLPLELEAGVADPKTLALIVDLLTPLVVSRPRDLASRDRLGLVLLRLENYAAAEGVLTDLVRDDPERASALNRLGLTLIRRKKVKESVGAFAMAVKLEPKNEKYRLNFAGGLVALADIENDWEGVIRRALSEYAAATRIHPRGWHGYVGQGDCILKLDPTDDPKAQKAIGLYEKALEPDVNPSCWQAHLKLALIYYDVWREGEGHRKALRHFEEAAAIRPPSEWKQGARQAYDELRKKK